MADKEKPGQGMRTWVKVLLVSSLALNLMFVGLACGLALRVGGGKDGRPPSVGAALYRAMPEADRRALRKEVRRSHDREAERARHRGDLLAVAETLRAAPFDRAALETLVRAHLMARPHGLDQARMAWIGRVAAMTDAERAAYADRVVEVFDAPPRKARWFGKDR